MKPRVDRTLTHIVLLCFVSSLLMLGLIGQILGFLGHHVGEGATINVSRSWWISERSPSSDELPPNAQKALENPLTIVFSDGKRLISIPADQGKVLAELQAPYFDQKRQIGRVMLVVGIFAVSLLLGGVILFYQRIMGARARLVIDAISRGELKARFPVTRFDEVGKLADQFNRMADTIEGLVHQLRQKETERTQMLRELSHDTRTPLTTLRYLTERLADPRAKWTEKERRKQSQVLSQEVQYFYRLIEDLFLLAEMEQNQTRSREAFDLREILAQEIPKVHQSLSSRAKITTHLGTEAALVLSEKFLVGRLIRNLVENALIHTRSKVEVSLEISNGKARLEICDNGKGFSSSALETFGKRRSSRFIDSQAKERISLGLGSVIAHSIATNLGGSVGVQNRTSGNRILGAIVTVEIPLSAGSQNQAA